MQQPIRDRSHTEGAAACLVRIRLVVGLATVGLLGGLGVALAACSGSGSGPTAAQDAGPSSAPPSEAAAAPESPAPASPRASVGPDPSALEFHADQVSFEYPVGWHTRKGTLNPGGNESIVFVGPTELPSDCVENAQGGICQSWPVMRLGPNGAVFAWRWFGRPGLEPPAVGDSTTVGGHAARVSKGSADPECVAVGGDESIDVTVLPIGGASGWFAAEACLAGPDRTPGESAFEAMVASAQIK